MQYLNTDFRLNTDKMIQINFLRGKILVSQNCQFPKTASPLVLPISAIIEMMLDVFYM